MKTRTLQILMLVLVLLPTMLTAQYLSIQGVARDNAGQSLEDGNYTFTFRLYDDETGGMLVWNENQTLAVLNGVFATTLGAVSSLEEVSFDAQYWLSIEIDGNGELSPRTIMTLSPYGVLAGVSGVDNVFAQSGNVGIGTLFPEKALHVTGDIKTEGDLQVTADHGIIDEAGLPILETGSNAQFGDYTAITSGTDWNAGGEPVSIVASSSGAHVTRANSSGEPHTVALMDVEHDGGIKFMGGLYAMGAIDDQMKVVIGYVLSNGTHEGSGFTSTRTGEGLYTITFNSGTFSSRPFVLVSLSTTTTDYVIDNTIGSYAVTATSFKVGSKDIDGTNNGQPQDVGFSFIAIGPR